MAKVNLMDEPGVADLVAKHVEKAKKETARLHVSAAKAATAEHLEMVADDKAAVKLVKTHGAAVVAAMKAAQAGAAEAV